MIFIYFPCEFYIISNVIAYEILILNYNNEYGLGICLFFIINLHIYVMISQTYIYIYIYIYKILKIFLFDPMVQLVTHWLNQWPNDRVTMLIDLVNVHSRFNNYALSVCSKSQRFFYLYCNSVLIHFPITKNT